jgi:hypothetical protein
MSCTYLSLQGKGIINNYIFFINIYFKLMNIGRNSYKKLKINSAVQIQIKTYQSFFQVDH